MYNLHKPLKMSLRYLSQNLRTVSKKQHDLLLFQNRLNKQPIKRLAHSQTISKTSNGKYKNHYTRTKSLALTSATISSLLLYWYQQNSNFNDAISNDSGKFEDKKPIKPEEVAKHNTADDCWMVIEGQVYNMTDFIDIHPGGPLILQLNCGMDVTPIFKPLHARGTLEKYIKPEWYMGPLDGKMPTNLVADPYTPGETVEEIMTKSKLKQNLPSLNNILNLYDFENLAKQIVSNQAWGYYSSGADDEISMRENHNAFHRIFFKPKVLVDVSEIDLSTKMLGDDVDLPFYVTATALMKLGNPQDGEVGITRGCGQSPWKIPQMISTLASCSIDEIVEAKQDKQIQWYQLYVNSDRTITEELIKHIEGLGLKALFVTVDAPSLGHREKDLKIKFSTSNSGPKVMSSKSSNNNNTKNHNDTEQGATRAISKFIDPSLTWDDIIKLKSLTKLPIIIKGVQRSEDVIKAAELGCSGVVLSNHGGRQLDFSRAPIEVLAEAKPKLDSMKINPNFEIFIDGGIRRGTDILKALCLGATGVGLGRPFIYANSCYGEDGVAHAIKLLREELEMDMRLLGAKSIKDLNSDFLDLTTLKNRNVSVARDELYNTVYRPSIPIDIKHDNE